MKLLKKIQSLPEKTRKIILWLIVIILALVLFTFWFNNFQEKLGNFQSKSFWEKLNLSEIKMPQLPETSNEELEKIKESLKTNGTENPETTK